LYSSSHYRFFRVLRRIGCLNTEPDDRPLIDTFSSLASEEQACQSFGGISKNCVRIFAYVIAVALGGNFYFTVL
jgi:hypothetical protein